VKGIFVGSDAFETMACHFLLILMAACTQRDYLFLTSSLPHAVGEMGIESFGPVGCSMATHAPRQCLIDQSLALTPNTCGGTIHRVVVTVLAGWQIFGVTLFTAPLSRTVNAGPVFFNHICVGKLFTGGGLFDVATRGTIYLFHITVRDLIQPRMAAFAPEFSMDR